MSYPARFGNDPVGSGPHSCGNYRDESRIRILLPFDALRALTAQATKFQTSGSRALTLQSPWPALLLHTCYALIEH